MQHRRDQSIGQCYGDSEVDVIVAIQMPVFVGGIQGRERLECLNSQIQQQIIDADLFGQFA